MNSRKICASHESIYGLKCKNILVYEVKRKHASSYHAPLFYLSSDIPSIQMLTNVRKYIVNETAVKFTCQWMNLSYIDLISKMQLVKDGISFHQWPEHKLVGHTFTTLFPARVSHTGRYQCKGTIGAASRYSSPFDLVVGSKYSYYIFYSLEKFILLSLVYIDAIAIGRNKYDRTMGPETGRSLKECGV